MKSSKTNNQELLKLILARTNSKTLAEALAKVS